MVIERLSRLPRKLMPRMFKGFTGKKKTDNFQSFDSKWHVSTLAWVPPCHFIKKQLNPNLMGIAAKTQSHCHRHHALSTSFSHVGLRKTSIGVCKVHFMPRMCITACRPVVNCPLIRSINILCYFSNSKCHEFFFFGGGVYNTVCGTSPTRNQTHSPCSGSMESYPLDHQGSPRCQ